MFPNNSRYNDTFDKLLDFVALDENKDLGDTLGTTAGGISAPLLVKMLCKRSLISIIWDYSTKHSIKKESSDFYPVTNFRKATKKS